MVVVAVLVVAAAAAAVVVVVVRGGKLAFGCFGAHNFSTYRSVRASVWVQRACIGRVAKGQRGGGMRVLGVFENLAGKCVCS